MDCPVCKSSNSSVLDTRKLGGTLKRRRLCDECGRKYSTIEISQKQFLQMQTDKRQLVEEMIRKIMAVVR